MASSFRRADDLGRGETTYRTFYPTRLEALMKLHGIALVICGLGMLISSTSARAQDADKMKLTEIETKFAEAATPGPAAGAVLKQYLYDANLFQVTGIGRVGMMPKSTIIEIFSKPNPTDPDVKSAQKLSDIRIGIYGETALVGYKMTNTDTGHKDPALNVTDHFGCLDTFIKRTGQWYIVGSACSPDAPISKAEWDADMKAMGEAPKPMKDAYH